MDRVSNKSISIQGTHGIANQNDHVSPIRKTITLLMLGLLCFPNLAYAQFTLGSRRVNQDSTGLIPHNILPFNSSNAEMCPLFREDAVFLRSSSIRGEEIERHQEKDDIGFSQLGMANDPPLEITRSKVNQESETQITLPEIALKPLAIMDFEEMSFEEYRDFVDMKMAAIKSYNFQELQEQAEQGSADALVKLYEIYINGMGVEKDEKKAFECVKRAADLNSIEALLVLEVMYHNSIGTEKDQKKAFECVKKAADLGSIEALLRLDILYLSSIGTEKDYEKAFESVKKAAQLGSIEGHYRLGLKHYFSIGLEKDIPEACTHYKIAADHGHRKAKNFLKINPELCREKISLLSYLRKLLS